MVLLVVAGCFGFAARVSIPGLLEKVNPQRVERIDRAANMNIKRTNFSTAGATEESATTDQAEPGNAR